jgi:hypothetical protein
MSSEAMKKFLENLLPLPASELKDHFPRVLEEIRNYGIGKLLEEVPGFMADLLNKMKQADPARLLSETPGAADRLADILWECVASRAIQSKTMKSALEGMDREFRGNIESSDSPFRTHFVVEQGKIRGGSGLLHFKDEDFRFMGPTEVLMELLTGDLHLGFGNLRLQTAGHPGWLRRIAPVMREINKLIRGA